MNVGLSNCSRVDGGHVANVIADGSGGEGEVHDCGHSGVGGLGGFGAGRSIDDLGLGVTRFQESKPCEKSSNGKAFGLDQDKNLGQAQVRKRSEHLGVA